MKYLFFVLTICTFIACSGDDLVQGRAFADCADVLENFQSYNGEEIGCESFYTLTEYNGEQYLELDSRCADLVLTVINEDCRNICEVLVDDDLECGQYLQDREIVEILYIEK